MVARVALGVALYCQNETMITNTAWMVIIPKRN